MACTVADFQTRFPEFCEVDDDRVQLFLDDTALLMGSESRWCDFYNVAQCYYTAHLLVAAEATEAGDDGILAPVKKQEVDDVVIEHAVGSVSATSDDLNSTSYGKRYLHYRRICFVGIYAV